MVLSDKMYDFDTETIDFSNQVKSGNFTRLDLVNLICKKYKSISSFIWE